ncbi:hypothetical protein, partial [Methylobacterium nigriterrae]|uniref:hypothetical protein n=1 Tax=Methylobacterium nigriterrae TaxID=3127512 RepID=UPI003013CAB0
MMQDALYNAIAESLSKAGYMPASTSSEGTAEKTAPPHHNLIGGVAHSPRTRLLPLLAAGGGWCLLSLGAAFCLHDELAVRFHAAGARMNCTAGCQGARSTPARNGPSAPLASAPGKAAALSR